MTLAQAAKLELKHLEKAAGRLGECLEALESLPLRGT